MTPLRVFIGYDPRQPIAFQVAAHSVWQHATAPVSITRLDLRNLPITRRGLTEFTYSRFLVPYLSGFEGVSIFLDSDVLVRGDVAELLAYPLAYQNRKVFFVDSERKFERPSVMVFRNELCTRLTPEYVEDKRNKLFDFYWVDGNGDLGHTGNLPNAWNHLVGYDAPNPDAKLVHFTAGIPVWPETEHCEFADEWHAAMKASMSTVSFDALMGRSVHPPAVAKRMKVGT